MATAFAAGADLAPRGRGSEDASDPFVSPNAGPNHLRYSTFDSQMFALSTGSAEQAKRALEAHLAETDRRMEEAGKLGTALVQQRKELEERLQEVEKLQSEEELTPDLKQKLVEIEKDYNEVARESARAFLPKQRVPSNEAAGSPFAPQGKGGRRSVSPSKFETQATGSPTKLSVPNRKIRNQPANRVHDIEFAAEISTSLIAQVRNLQSLLTEREEELRDLKVDKSKLEIEAEGFEQRLKTLDESEHRYKDENWNLETQVHELLAAQKDAADREKKLTSTLTALQADKNATQRDLDEIKMNHAKLADEHAAIVKSHDIELGTAKRSIAMAESERAAMQRKIDDLTSQNTELARAFSLQRGRVLDRDPASGLSDEDFETAADNITPEHSPPPSPVKGTPRHSMLESETLKTSLHHAQRTIQSLRTNVHREKTEKLELKRMLQEARDELEKMRSDPSASRRSRKVDSREFKKPLRSSQLGGARSSRTELYLDDPEWEENGDASPSQSQSPLRSSVSRGSDLAAAAAGETTDHFETANETSDAAFETAHERGTETEDFHTGAEEFSDDDDDAVTETESLSRGAGRIKRPPVLPLNQPGSRYSFLSTASTSNDEDEYSFNNSEARTPTAAAPPQKMRLRVSRGALSRRSRQPSEEPNLQSSPASFANSSAAGTPQAPGQSLFAELGDFEGSDDESLQATPSRRSIRSFTRGRTASPAPELPALPRAVMVDSGTMTEPVELRSLEERPLSAVSYAAAGTNPAATSWLDVMSTRDGERSRPLSMLSYSDAGAQHDPDMEEKLAQFPSPPSSRLGLVRTPILPPPQTLGMSNIASEHVEPRAQPPPALGLSRILGEHVEPVSEPEAPPPAPPALSLSTISGQHVEPMAEPEPPLPAPPQLAFAPIHAEHVEPRAEPEAPAPAPALSLSTIRGEHVAPVAEPETPKSVAPLAAAAAAAAAAVAAVEPALSVSAIHAQSLEPVAEPPAEVPAPPAPPALTLASIRGEHVEPQAEPELPMAPPAPLSWSTIRAEHVEPRADEPPRLTQSTIYAQDVEPQAEPAPDHSLDYSTIQWVGTEPVEPRSPRRNGFIIPRDADSPQETRPKTPSHAVFGSPLARGKGKTPSTPIIAEDETRQSPSDTPLSETPESQRPFKEISTNSFVKPARKQPAATADQGAQTSLTSEQLDELLVAGAARPGKVSGHQRMESLGSSMGTPGAHRRRVSQDSFSSVIRHKIKSDDAGSELSVEGLALRRPGSASSVKTGPAGELPPLPPLPPNHREAIEAARTGSAHGAPSSAHGPPAPGAMGPPLFPASAYNKNPYRPRTPSISKPMSPVSGRGTPTPRANRGTSGHGTTGGEVQSPSRNTARSRRSSVSSFVSELDNRFGLHGAGGMDPASYYGSNTDPRMIQAITQTMIGETLWKYTRKAGRGEMSGYRHQRYFWIHPYTRTLYWSERDPFTSPGEKAKSVPIEAVRVVTDDNPNPPGLHRKSLVVVSRGRAVKMTCHTSQRHETWFNALSYLLQRTDDEGQADAEEVAGGLTREDVDEFNPPYGRRPGLGTRAPGTRPAPPASLSSYNSRTTRNESPAFDMGSMRVPTLTPTHKKAAGGSSERPPMGTLGRLSGVWRSGGNKMSGTFASLRGRRGSTQNQSQGQIYEASEAFDSAEDLRQMYEQQDRESDRLENVRACCDAPLQSIASCYRRPAIPLLRAPTYPRPPISRVDDPRPRVLSRLPTPAHLARPDYPRADDPRPDYPRPSILRAPTSTVLRAPTITPPLSPPAQTNVETKARPPRAQTGDTHAKMATAGHAKSDKELSINIQKATNAEETAPKRKHVRSCIVYTWDNKSSLAFWAGIKVQPILADEVQTYKALITIHKVLQEGHPISIKEAMANRGWIDSLNRGMAGEGVRGYGPLIREYVYFLLAKLSFHQQHPEFNGTFEYEEYVSLKVINDPNEGYEAITDLMTLQDKIDQFQKLVFSHFRHSGNNECRISSLVPLVQESYGIYKFITSMLRAMHSTTGDDEALEPLRGRYDAQHYRLVKFYYECSNLRYLTSLITIPKLPQDPPNLLAEDESAPALPARPKQEIERAPSPARAPKNEEPDEISEFWKGELDRQNREYEEQQRVLEERQQAQARAQQEAALQAQRDFEDQQRRLAEQQRREQDALAAQQAQWQTQGRLAELERENLNARAQYERDQLMLQQYDQRVKALEAELAQLQAGFGQQVASKDDQIRALQEQVNTWRSKYENLAKLYSQLRHEHLDLLQKFKGVQLKAASAQEAVDRRDKLEREIKTKNLELADMIRERDRALHDRDRLTGSNKDEVDKLRRELRAALDRADNLERSKGNELSTMLAKYNREMADLEEALRAKSRALEDHQARLRDGSADLEQLLRDKEEELEVYKAATDQTLLELSELKQNQGASDSALDGQIDALVLASLAKINDIIDSVLQSGVQRVDDALYELDSSMQAGNQNASPAYVLSQIEKASSSAMEFATAFNNFIADGPNAAHADVIKAVNVCSGAIADVCSNTKGLTRLATDDKKTDALVNGARQSAQSALKLFRGLQSFRLEGMDPIQRTDVVINGNNDVQINLQKLNKLVEAFAPGFGKLLVGEGGDLGDVVDRELSKAADAIAAAAARLAKLRSKPRDGYSTHELRVHDSILDAATAVTDAIAQLIRAATATQQEIVQAGRGTSSRTAFYKKNNRWTEGLVSAAKAVAASTATLIETADGVLSGRHSPEQLIVASNDVAASTAQLVAASRVKAGFMSRSQEALEQASKAVGAACRALVRQVQGLIRERRGGAEEERVDYATLGAHEFKVREMEQQLHVMVWLTLFRLPLQVEILQLENALSAARSRLGEMRKISYREE
ncbi:uncharacterized protein E0L32_004979 [Thyridium curvatum]|uniref:PH domain-containing protein n=1 Tax=Thyridium curvatum TaxID=1093900 RepID=A0A507BEB0_9PEZI|nr:uncharacterized protein E0L32_004979 [Thyridium curvatum]TPX14870.1 hypothetical protein E0L32_004979 [Thyridium curvatum]